MKASLIDYARSLGFERIGFTSAKPLEKDERFLLDWIKQGRAGDMHYLERHPARRSRPDALLPGARTVIVLAKSYGGPTAPSVSVSAEGKMARYARGEDYHKGIRKRLESFVRYLESVCPDARCRTFVDTGPLLERALAQRAGLGFIGKNTMLITRGLGSWVFLASVLTTAEFPNDEPDGRSCGSCRLCIDACPTQAITAPFELDPRRCIAYWTIESRASIDVTLRDKMSGWIFGCDICQEVCPHNKGSTDFEAPALGLSELLSIRDDRDFQARFAGTPLMRAGRVGLLRSGCVAAVHLKRKDLILVLRRLAHDDRSAIVREHASWAVTRLEDSI